MNCSIILVLICSSLYNCFSVQSAFEKIEYVNRNRIVVAVMPKNCIVVYSHVTGRVITENGNKEERYGNFCYKKAIETYYIYPMQLQIPFF